MKLHRNLCQAVVQTLARIFGEEKAHADKALEAILRADPRRGARDRAFIAENTYEIVRYARLLGALLGREPKTEADWWAILGIRLLLAGENPLPEWPEWHGLDYSTVWSKREHLQQVRALRESVPDWLDDLGVSELGQRWDAALAALNRPAPVALRVNTLKANVEQVRQMLLGEGIETSPAGKDGLVLVKRANVFRTKAFQSGSVEVQDVSSQLVAPYLDVQPGHCVIDACAGGGGKTLHIAALMQNQGRLIALDTEAWKLEELRKRARRAGAYCIETRPITSSKVIKRLHGIADRLLLDVPCSGLGVLRRNPDAKWKLQPEQIENLRLTQQGLLARYTQMLKPGGLCVYATCSILPSENEAQVQLFLNANADNYRLVRQKSVFPGEEGGDGFFMALFERRF